MGDSIFSGLESFGLSGLEGMSLYEDEKKKEEAEKAEKAVKKVEASPLEEKDYLLLKTQKCPLCDFEIKAKMVKGGKAKLLSTDVDLRPRYQGIDIIKYDVISCPRCGYTALTRYFPTLLKIQAERIKEKISRTYQAKPDKGETYSYDDALERYKLALINAVVKGAKPSEKAYICLKASWMCRAKAEECEPGSAELNRINVFEEEYTKNAYDGFIQAVASESFPMCGMDEITVDYILSVLAYKTDHLDVASKLIAKILQSNSANARQKDRARELKEEVLKKLKAKG